MFRKLILKLLKLDSIESRIEELEKDNKLLNKKLNTSSRKILENEDLRDRLDFILHRVEELVKVGIDVHEDNLCESWAVVCIKGKPETCVFYDLSLANHQEVVEFLREFKRFHKDTIIDAHPQHSKHIHYDIGNKEGLY